MDALPLATSDLTLWERWRDGRDAQAFHEIVARYAGMVYATGRRILGNPEDAEDVTQDCFLRLAAADRRIDISTSLAGWLHRAAYNRALIVLRSELRRRERERRGPPRENAASEPGWEEIRGLVDEAIERLPGNLRAVVVAHFLERATLESIAGRLGISRRQVEYRADLVLLPGSAVSGTVLDAGGAVVPNVDVHLAPEVRHPSGYLGANVRTVADGLFRFEMVPAGKHLIGAAPGGPKETEVTLVECDGLSDVTGVVLRVEGPAAPRVGRIAGRVIDDAGAPVPDARLSLSGFSPRKTSFRAKAIAGKDGSFSFEEVPYGAYNLLAEVAWHISSMLPGVGLDDGPLEVVLLQTAKSIRGRVIERSEGKPVADAAVRLFPVGGDPTVMKILAGGMPDGPRKAKTGADGTFAFGDVPSGRIRVQANAPGLAFGWSKEVSVDPGGEMEGVDVVLSAGGSIEGIVLGPDGKPMPDATVRAREPSGKTFVEQSSGRRVADARARGCSFERSDDEGRSVCGMHEEVTSCAHSEHFMSSVTDV